MTRMLFLLPLQPYISFREKHRYSSLGTLGSPIKINHMVVLTNAVKIVFYPFQG